MDRVNRIPDFKKMYPDASDAVIEVLKKSERKMIYQKYDLKKEDFYVDEEKEITIFVESREDSLE